MGVDDVAHIPAKYLADVLSLSGNGGDRSASRITTGGPGYIRLGFSKARSPEADTTIRPHILCDDFRCLLEFENVFNVRKIFHVSS